MDKVVPEGTTRPGALSSPAGRANGANGKPRPRLRTPVDHQRSEFLRRCRARISPEQVGLPPTSRARNGGLRREDVAALSGVSASWYTWLEQGRDIRVSDEVLERVSQALRMSDDERTYLFSLVQHRLPRLSRDTGAEAPPDVLRMIQALPHPAVVMNLRCDILAWNEANSALYFDYSNVPASERNLLEILFISPVRPLTTVQLENAAKRLIGRLRFDYSKCAEDPKFEALFHRLMTHSPLFRKFWRGPDVALHAFGLHSFDHPRFGPLTFEHTTYVPDGYPYIRVVMCTPESVAARNAVATLAAERAAAVATSTDSR